MSKSALKTAIAIEQEGVDPLTGEILSLDPRLNDTDRKRAKAKGGTYDQRSNVRVLVPRSHMERHGTLRTREEQLEFLKSTFDDRVQVMKLYLKINNQLLAYQRRVDHEHPATSAFLAAQLEPVGSRLAELDKAVEHAIKAYDHPLVLAALTVPGLGPITVSALTVYVDLAKAATPSALWKYCGLHCASHERYTRGEASGGNKTLRTVLWNAANVMVRLGEGGYREVYDRTKARLEQSEKAVQTRNTQGHLVESTWRETKPCHRHGAALRAVMKHLLADYWLVGRTLAGLPTVPLYAESLLGHTHVIAPSERGWKF